jgi:uncharacterized membrane protein YdjX (TVP38/TMEM64 family)
MKTAVRNKLLLIALLAALAAVAKFSGVADNLTFENVKSHKETIHLYVKAHPVSSPLIYVAAYTLAVALSIPGAAVLTIAGGFLFGVIWATLYVNIGALVGSAVAFLITRYLLGDWLQKKYGPRLQQFNREVISHGPHYLLALRFMPAFPFFLVNILAGLTRIRLTTFIWTTSVGILPGDLVYSYAGSRIDNMASTGDVLSVRILIAFALLVFFSLSPVAIGYIRKHPARKNGI